jgi:hypothetical protein
MVHPGLDQGKEDRVTRPEDLQQWEAQVGPTLQTLMATLGAAGVAAGHGPVALLAASDQLNAAARDTRVWLSTTRCPLPDIDDRLVRTLRSLRILARLMEAEASTSASPNVKVIHQEIEGLIAMIANTVAVLSDRTGS